MKKPLCIAFAGPVGSSKSPIATYLSWNLGLPIFSRDPIRSEVREDTLVVEKDPDIFRKLANDRLNELISTRKSFILDSSLDRVYEDITGRLRDKNYDIYIISIDISKELLAKLYKAKGYMESLERIEEIYEDHQNFLKKFGEYVNLNIDDGTFKNRMNISLKKVKDYMEDGE